MNINNLILNYLLYLRLKYILYYMLLYFFSFSIILLPYLFYYLYPEVDEKTEKFGGQLVAKVLKSHGVKHIFTLVGGHISPILVSAKKEGIKVIDVRHEVNTVFAADACGRLTNVPGVAIVTAGPGVTNTVTALKNAQMAESPLILIGGASATLLKGRGSLQDIDQISLMKTVCKRVFTCKQIKKIVPTLKKAFLTAKSYPQGPVFIEFPIDTLYPYQTVKKEAFGKSKPKNLIQKIIHSYITYQVNYVFDRAFSIQYDFQPLSEFMLDPGLHHNLPIISEETIQKSLTILSKSKKPLCIIGSQIIQSNKEYHKFIIQQINKLNIPCYLTGMARGLLGRGNPIQFIHNRTPALKEADVILLLGVTCDFRLGYGKKLNKKAKIISVNHNSENLNLNHGIFWNSSIKIHGEINYFLQEISKKYQYSPSSNEWMDILDKRENVRDIEIQKMAEKKYPNLVNPIHLLNSFKETLERNSIIICDGGDFIGTAAYTLRPNYLGWIDPGPFGTLGVGAGFALGAKLCFPEKTVWILYGDGSCGYSLMEYDTFVRHNINVNCLIGNDACWSQIEREQIPMFNDDVACKLEYTDYHKFTEILDDRVHGAIIKKEEDIKGIVDLANYSSKPVLINALIAKTDFRKGSISV